jgi:hypothetical protein
MSPAARRWRALSMSLLSPLPTKAYYSIDARGRSRLRRALAELRPHVVVLNHGDIVSFADEIPRDTGIILVSHNVESEIIRGKFAAMRVPAPARRILDRDIRKTRMMEEAGAARVRFVMAVSQSDAEWYRALSPDIEVAVVSGAFSYEPYRGRRQPVRRPLAVGYLAKLTWWPNREGADWFLSSVLSKLSPESLVAHYFGPGTEDYQGRHAMLRAHGFVESLDAMWSAVNFSVCPILNGSGVNIKLIEALYNGIPVLATPHAVRGLPEFDDGAIAVVPPEEWVDFLQSDRALCLAAATVKPETREHFAIGEGASRCRRLLERAATAASASA